MIIKKLAVPLVNEKVLQQAEYCYIATAAISEAGFDFVRSRIPTKTKMDIITGLDVPTSPDVLRRIWRNYQGRITLNIYTQNTFQANLYIFELPYRKAVAFVGSGHFTLEGLKDSEQLFYKITDAKEIENMKSWFIGYYEFAQPLTEALIEEYAFRYPIIRQRDYISRLEMKQFSAITANGFRCDNINFKHQYFKKADYLTLSSSNALHSSPEIHTQRSDLRTKLLALHDQVKNHLRKLKLYEIAEQDPIASSLHPSDHADRQLRSMWIAYGRDTAKLKKEGEPSSLTDFSQLQTIINQSDVTICLVVGSVGKGKADRQYFKDKMIDSEYRKQTLTLLKGLNSGYWIDVACERKGVDTFPTEDSLWEFTKGDDWRYYDFKIGKNFSPGAIELSNDKIADTIMKECEPLALLYEHMKAPVTS